MMQLYWNIGLAVVFVYEYTYKYKIYVYVMYHSHLMLSLLLKCNYVMPLRCPRTFESQDAIIYEAIMNIAFTQRESRTVWNGLRSHKPRTRKNKNKKWIVLSVIVGSACWVGVAWYFLRVLIPIWSSCSIWLMSSTNAQSSIQRDFNCLSFSLPLIFLPYVSAVQRYPSLSAPME